MTERPATPSPADIATVVNRALSPILLAHQKIRITSAIDPAVLQSGITKVLNGFGPVLLANARMKSVLDGITDRVVFRPDDVAKLLNPLLAAQTKSLVDGIVDQRLFRQADIAKLVQQSQRGITAFLAQIEAPDVPEQVDVTNSSSGSIASRSMLMTRPWTRKQSHCC